MCESLCVENDVQLKCITQYTHTHSDTSWSCPILLKVKLIQAKMEWTPPPPPNILHPPIHWCHFLGGLWNTAAALTDTTVGQQIYIQTHLLRRCSGKMSFHVASRLKLEPQQREIICWFSS